MAAGIQRSSLARSLRAELDGDVQFDKGTRGRYSTDASIYQIEPIGMTDEERTGVFIE